VRRDKKKESKSHEYIIDDTLLTFEAVATNGRTVGITDTERAYISGHLRGWRLLAETVSEDVI
jgi:hypothetical protein